MSDSGALDFVEAVCSSDREAIRDLLMEPLPDPSRWVALHCRLSSGKSLTAEARQQFHSVWIEFGAKIRRQVGDDRRLASLLRTLLPSYRGEGLRLFRGENVDRYSQGRLGFCWTSVIEKAQMFGSGLNASHGAGGILLSAMISPASIIAEPNKHSVYLGEHEYTVDPFSLGDVEVVERYPQRN